MCSGGFPCPDPHQMPDSDLGWPSSLEFWLQSSLRKPIFAQVYYGPRQTLCSQGACHGASLELSPLLGKLIECTAQQPALASNAVRKTVRWSFPFHSFTPGTPLDSMWWRTFAITPYAVSLRNMQWGKQSLYKTRYSFSATSRACSKWLFSSKEAPDHLPVPKGNLQLTMSRQMTESFPGHQTFSFAPYERLAMRANHLNWHNKRGGCISA